MLSHTVTLNGTTAAEPEYFQLTGWIKGLFQTKAVSDCWSSGKYCYSMIRVPDFDHSLDFVIACLNVDKAGVSETV